MRRILPGTRLKVVLKCVVFVCIFALLFWPVSNVLLRKSFEPPWNMTPKIHGFYNEPENSFDLMFFGSSHMYCSVNPLLLFEQDGVPSYLFCSQKQPLWITYHYMIEALKTQRPKLMVLDIYMMYETEEYLDDGTNFAAVDHLKLSWNKLACIQAIAPAGERFQYLCNFVKYHSRWDELVPADYDFSWMGERDYLKGHVPVDEAAGVASYTDVSQVTALNDISNKNKEYLNQIMNLCEQENISLLLIKTPCNETIPQRAYTNSVEQLARERNLAFVDFNLCYEEIGLEVPDDFCDYWHLNYGGAEKFTAYFGEYLRANYSLPDHRGEAAYESWQEDIASYRQSVGALS